MLGHSREVHACKTHSTNKPACLPACHILFSFFSLRQCCYSFHSHLVCFVHKLIYELLAHSYSCFIFFVWGTFANGVHIFCLAKPFRLILAHKQIRCGFIRLFYFFADDLIERAENLQLFIVFMFFFCFVLHLLRLSFSSFSLSLFLFHSANVITKSFLKTNNDYKNTHQQHFYLFGCLAYCTQSSAEEIWIKKTY